MSREQQTPNRMFKVITRLMILLAALVGVFFASFFVTLTIKSDRPLEVIKHMMSKDDKQKPNPSSDPDPRKRPSIVEDQKTDPKTTVDDPKIDRPTEDRSTEDRSTTDDQKYSGSGWASKLERLKSIKSAVAERIKDREHYVPLEEIPRSLKQAIVAIEDSRFYSHKGFDPEGIARATVVNVEAGQIEEGASTITQQLVKNLFLSQEQSFTRKLEEIVLAINLERNFSKDEILELYLNTIYFGSNFYGVYEAAEGYFGKEPRDLTLAESAMLAGLPQAPSLYSPYVDFLAAKNRQLLVINAMVKANVLTNREAERARNDLIVLAEGEERSYD